MSSYEYVKQIFEQNDMNDYKLIERTDGSVIIQDPTNAVSIGIPANYTGNMDMVYYFPGFAQQKQDGHDLGITSYDLDTAKHNLGSQEGFVCQIMDSNPNTISVAGGFTRDSASQCVNAAAPILNVLNLNIDTTIYSGWSDGGLAAVNNLNTGVSKYNYSTNTMAVFYDSDHFYDIADKKTLKTLKDNNIPVVLVGGQRNPLTGNSMNVFTEAGVEVIWIHTDEAGHREVMDDAVRNNIYSYLLGNTDNITDRNNDCHYYALRYDHENKKWVSISLKEAQKIMLANNERDMDDILTHSIDWSDDGYDGFKTKYYKDTRTVKDYSYLTKLKSKKISMSKYTDSNLKSNIQYIEKAVNNIRMQIRNSGFLKGVSKGSFRSSSGIPGCLNAYIDAYYKIMGNLMDLIKEQTEAIISYGQAYCDMDADLRKKAEKLADGTYVGGIVEK